jgi:hypothetical protein
VVSKRLQRALDEIKNETVVSVLRAATAHLVDASLERVADHIVGLARAKEAAELRAEQLSGELERYRARVCRWAEEAMTRRDRTDSDRELIERLNQENVRLLQESAGSVRKTADSVHETGESVQEDTAAQLCLDGLITELDAAIAGGQSC